jgi:radical SAM protein (TIGR01212 family)
VELGLQTIHEKSAEYLRRGYPLAVYEEAVNSLKKQDLNVITHVILGLPGETFEDMKDTVRHVCECGTDGIKLQLLHVLKGTDLAREYEEGKFEVMEEEEYLDLISELLQIIPKNIVIHRLTGDGSKKDLIAPLWSADKKHVLNRMKEKLKR